jgi:hypothetical protein
MSAGEGRYTRFLTADPRRTHRIAAYADDTVLLAEQIQRLHRFLGETDNPAGREVVHRRRYAEYWMRCHRSHYLRGHCLIYLGQPFS